MAINISNEENFARVFGHVPLEQEAKDFGTLCAQLFVAIQKQDIKAVTELCNEPSVFYHIGDTFRTLMDESTYGFNSKFPYRDEVRSHKPVLIPVGNEEILVQDLGRLNFLNFATVLSLSGIEAYQNILKVLLDTLKVLLGKRNIDIEHTVSSSFHLAGDTVLDICLNEGTSAAIRYYNNGNVVNKINPKAYILFLEFILNHPKIEIIANILKIYKGDATSKNILAAIERLSKRIKDPELSIAKKLLHEIAKKINNRVTYNLVVAAVRNNNTKDLERYLSEVTEEMCEDFPYGGLLFLAYKGLQGTDRIAMLKTLLKSKLLPVDFIWVIPPYTGMTLLGASAHDNQLDVMNLSLEYGADVSAGLQEKIPILLAIEKRATIAVRRLLEHDPTLCMQGPKSPLIEAIKAHPLVVQDLLSVKADPNAYIREERVEVSPLFVAIREHKRAWESGFDCVQGLLNAKADPIANCRRVLLIDDEKDAEYKKSCETYAIEETPIEYALLGRQSAKVVRQILKELLLRIGQSL